MASSSKLLDFALSSSFLRSCRFASTYLLPATSRGHPASLLSIRFCSAAPAASDVATDPAVAAVSDGHPWPEWGQFLEKLLAKGYFEQAPPPSGVSAVEDTYPLRDLNRVKNACIKFARDRFDILSSLPKQDIQAIVKYGCPNTNRKPVNSAKKLREFVGVKEEDACGACKLRESCDRAYVTPMAEDQPRTVNVVRILLQYALDTNSLSGEHSINESVQESARKLLSELIILGDTPIDPSLPKPVFPQKLSDKSKAKAQATEMKKGDWLCTNCNFLNFARNRKCLECKADGPRKIEAAPSEMKMGDWICTQCHFMNFARNKICFKCEETRPKRQLNPGEWECPSCCYLNFSRNRICKKCNQDRPEDGTQNNQLEQRNRRGGGKSRSFDYMNEDSDNDGDASSYERFSGHKHKASMKPKPNQRITTAKSRDYFDLEDGLHTAKLRSF